MKQNWNFPTIKTMRTLDLILMEQDLIKKYEKEYGLITVKNITGSLKPTDRMYMNDLEKCIAEIKKELQLRYV